MKTDVVCEMEVDERNADYVTTYEGKTYYFCSRECQNEFDQDPRRYMGPMAETLDFEPPSHAAGGTAPKQKDSNEQLLR